MPTPQSSPMQTAKGFFAQLFSRQHKPQISPPELVHSSPNPLAPPPSHPRHAQIEPLIDSIETLLRSPHLQKQELQAQAMSYLDRLQTLRKQYQQALKAVQMLGPSADRSALDATLKTLQSRFEQLKLELQKAERKASGTDPYATVIPSTSPPVAQAATGQQATQPSLDAPPANNPASQAPPEFNEPAIDPAVRARYGRVGPQTQQPPVDDGHAYDLLPDPNFGYDLLPAAPPAETTQPWEDPAVRARYGRPAPLAQADASAPTDDGFYWGVDDDEPEAAIEDDDPPDLQTLYPCTLARDLSSYQPAQALGHGASGDVQAYVDAQGHQVVLKQARNAEGEQTLRNEAQLFAQLPPHPNIVTCHGVAALGPGETQPGLVLEHIEGSTATAAMGDLQRRLAAGEITQAQYAKVVRYTLQQMAAAAQHLAEHGLAHNDLRFDNVMIDASTGQVKVIDLGITSPVDERHHHRVPVPYTAPEVLGNSTPTATSDAYAVGHSAYQMSEQQLHHLGAPIDAYTPAPEANTQLIQHAQPYVAHNDMPLRGPEGPDAKAAPDLRAAEVRFKSRFEAAAQAVRDFKLGAAHTDLVAEMSKGDTVAQALEPLLQRAAERARLGLLDQALGLLAEVETRLQDAQRSSGVQRAGTAYTDFVQRLMSGDPAQRMTLAQALAHPFLSDGLGSDEGTEDEAEARALLSSQVQRATHPSVPSQPADGNERATWLAHAERELARLRAYLPEAAQARDAALRALRTLPPTASALTAWDTQRQALQQQLSAARADKTERDQFQSALGVLGKQVDEHVRQFPLKARALVQALRSATTLAKPGGDLDQAYAQMQEIQRTLGLPVRVRR